MRTPSILFVTAELTPVAKVGGLADVADSLPQALARTGLADARIVLPYYDVVQQAGLATTVVLPDLVVPTPQGNEHVRVLRATIDENTVYLLEHAAYFGRDGVYLQHIQKEEPFAEMARFLFFSQTVTQLIVQLPDFRPEILHCHDWHTGLVPALVQRVYGPDAPATVFTVHNLAMQGRWRREEVLGALGLTPNDAPTFSVVDKNGNISLIEQGILASDVVNTVSKTYAKEILTPEYGAGVQDILQKRKNDLYGIVNGINATRFDPAHDASLRTPYSVETVTTQRPKNKVALQKEFGLPENPSAPLFGFVGRLTDQKGMELILDAFPEILSSGDTQLVVLGTGDPAIEQHVRDLASTHPTQIAAAITFDAALANRVYAGSDFFLMPSKFEPCGLGQLIALRYGAVPIVRSTGGLVDTVPDYTTQPAEGVGFRFSDFTPAALADALRRAIALYQDPHAYSIVQRRAMQQNVSWDASAPEYATLYARALKHHRG